MAEIPKTVIATSDPLNICSGFALFPKSDTLRFGSVLSETKTGTIFDLKDIPILVLRLNANAKYEVFYGFCGPAYAIKLDLEGAAENGTLVLTAGEDELVAGMIFGLTVSVSVNVMLDILEIHGIVWDGWHTHLKTSWERLADAKIKLEFDVLEILYEVVMAAIGHTGANGEAFEHIFTEFLKGSWGFYDERVDTFVKNKGEMIAKPGNNLQMDISGKFPQTYAFNEALKAFHGHFSFGPSFGYEIPVKVKMKTVTLGTTVYSDPVFDNTTKKVSLKTKGADPHGATTMKVELEHTVGFDVTAGIFMNLNLAKVFNVGFSVSFPLLSLLGINIKLGGPYDNVLSNTIGKTTAKACSECGTKPTSFMEVIFETPGGLGL